MELFFVLELESPTTNSGRGAGLAFAAVISEFKFVGNGRASEEEEFASAVVVLVVARVDPAVLAGIAGVEFRGNCNE